MTTIIQKLKVATMMFLVVMVGVGVTAKQKDKAYDIEGALCELDEAVANYSDFEQKRIVEIEQKKQELRHANFDNDRYLVMTQILEKYKKIRDGGFGDIYMLDRALNGQLDKELNSAK